MILATPFAFIVKRNWKNMYFHPKMAWPPANYDVIFLHTPLVRPRVKVLSGVLQGTVLAPLFFSMFVSDIGDNLSSKTNLCLFADDTVLYRSITSENDARIMQSDLANLFLWGSQWNLKFYLKESCVILFSRVTSSIAFSYEVEAVTLPVATHHPYLGIEISCDLSRDFN